MLSSTMFPHVALQAGPFLIQYISRTFSSVYPIVLYHQREYSRRGIMRLILSWNDDSSRAHRTTSPLLKSNLFMGTQTSEQYKFGVALKKLEAEDSRTNRIHPLVESDRS